MLSIGLTFRGIVFCLFVLMTVRAANIFFLIFIYLAASGLGCGTREASVAVLGLLSGGGAWALGLAGSVAGHGLSCPAAQGILVPRPGTEPSSPASEDGFLTTGPTWKSLDVF